MKMILQDMNLKNPVWLLCLETTQTITRVRVRIRVRKLGLGLELGLWIRELGN
jgi:hypothetical protein